MYPVNIIKSFLVYITVISLTFGSFLPLAPELFAVKLNLEVENVNQSYYPYLEFDVTFPESFSYNDLLESKYSLTVNNKSVTDFSQKPAVNFINDPSPFSENDQSITLIFAGDTDHHLHSKDTQKEILSFVTDIYHDNNIDLAGQILLTGVSHPNKDINKYGYYDHSSLNFGPYIDFEGSYTNGNFIYFDDWFKKIASTNFINDSKNNYLFHTLRNVKQDYANNEKPTEVFIFTNSQPIPTPARLAEFSSFSEEITKTIEILKENNIKVNLISNCNFEDSHHLCSEEGLIKATNGNVYKTFPKDLHLRYSFEKSKTVRFQANLEEVARDFSLQVTAISGLNLETGLTSTTLEQDLVEIGNIKETNEGLTFNLDYRGKKPIKDISIFQNGKKIRSSKVTPEEPRESRPIHAEIIDNFFHIMVDRSGKIDNSLDELNHELTLFLEKNINNNDMLSYAGFSEIPATSKTKNEKYGRLIYQGTTSGYSKPLNSYGRKNALDSLNWITNTKQNQSSNQEKYTILALQDLANTYLNNNHYRNTHQSILLFTDPNHTDTLPESYRHSHFPNKTKEIENLVLKLKKAHMTINYFGECKDISKQICGEEGLVEQTNGKVFTSYSGLQEIYDNRARFTDTKMKVGFQPITGGNSNISVHVNTSDGYIIKNFTVNLKEIKKNSPLILIPGIYGTELYAGSDIIFPELVRVGDIISPDEDLLVHDSVQNHSILKPKDILRTIRIGLNNKKFTVADIYQPLIGHLTKDLGYIEHIYDGGDYYCDPGTTNNSPDFFIFPYDWRKDNNDSAKDLEYFINQCIRKFDHLDKDKINIVAHSMGGLIAQKYLRNTNGEHVDNFISMATPWIGTPASYNTILTGDNPDILSAIPNLGHVKTPQLFSPNTIKTLARYTDSGSQLLPTSNYMNTKEIFKTSVDRGGSLGVWGTFKGAYETIENLNDLETILAKRIGSFKNSPETVNGSLHNNSFLEAIPSVNYLSIIGEHPKNKTISAVWESTTNNIFGENFDKTNILKNVNEKYYYKLKFGRGDGTVTDYSAHALYNSNKDNYHVSKEKVDLGKNFNHQSIVNMPKVWSLLDAKLSKNTSNTASKTKLKLSPNIASANGISTLDYILLVGTDTFTFEVQGEKPITYQIGQLMPEYLSVYLSGDNAYTLVVDTDKDYTITLSSNNPYLVEYKKGNGDNYITSHYRYVNPNQGQTGNLTLSKKDNISLTLIDENKETIIKPTIERNHLILDESAPDITLTPDKTTISVTTNDDSKVAFIYYQLNHGNITPYQKPFAAKNGDILTVIAADVVGNTNTITVAINGLKEAGSQNIILEKEEVVDPKDNQEEVSHETEDTIINNNTNNHNDNTPSEISKPELKKQERRSISQKKRYRTIYTDIPINLTSTELFNFPESKNLLILKFDQVVTNQKKVKLKSDNGISMELTHFNNNTAFALIPQNISLDSQIKVTVTGYRTNYRISITPLLPSKT